MLTLPELLEQLRFITQEVVLLGLFVTALIILVGHDWRFLILALLVQYVLTGLILSRLVRPDIAVLKIMIGTFICPILFLSVRQATVAFPNTLALNNDGFGRSKWLGWWDKLDTFVIGENRHRGQTPSGLIFKLTAGLLMIFVATTLSNMWPLPELSLKITVAVYWLALAGLVTLIMSEDPLKIGLGLFTLFTGFDLFYTTLQSSLLLIGLWGTVNLIIALVTGYLIVAKGAAPGEAR